MRQHSGDRRNERASETTRRAAGAPSDDPQPRKEARCCERTSPSATKSACALKNASAPRAASAGGNAASALSRSAVHMLRAASSPSDAASASLLAGGCRSALSHIAGAAACATMGGRGRDGGQAVVINRWFVFPLFFERQQRAGGSTRSVGRRCEGHRIAEGRRVDDADAVPYDDDDDGRATPRRRRPRGGSATATAARAASDDAPPA